MIFFCCLPYSSGFDVIIVLHMIEKTSEALVNSYGGVREYSRFWAQSRGVARKIKRIFHCTFNRNFLSGEGSFFSMSSAITPANLQIMETTS